MLVNLKDLNNHRSGARKVTDKEVIEVEDEEEDKEEDEDSSTSSGEALSDLEKAVSTEVTHIPTPSASRRSKRPTKGQKGVDSYLTAVTNEANAKASKTSKTSKTSTKPKPSTTSNTQSKSKPKRKTTDTAASPAKQPQKRSRAANAAAAAPAIDSSDLSNLDRYGIDVRVSITSWIRYNEAESTVKWSAVVKVQDLDKHEETKWLERAENHMQTDLGYTVLKYNMMLKVCAGKEVMEYVPFDYDWVPVQEQVKNFTRIGKKDILLAVEIEYSCPRFTEPLLEPTDSGTKKKKKGGNSTTQQQRVLLAGSQDNEKTTNKEAPLLAVRWACFTDGCRNNDRGLCWREDEKPENNPQFHHPITPNTGRHWARKIADGKATVDTPATSTITRLLAAGDGVKRRAPKQQPLPPQPQWSNLPLMMNPFGFQQYGSAAPPQPLPPPQRSSPIQVGDDAEEQLQRFFNFVKRRADMQKHKETLAAIERALNTREYDLECLHTKVKEDWWEEQGFKDGMLHRLRRLIKPFENYDSSDDS